VNDMALRRYYRSFPLGEKSIGDCCFIMEELSTYCHYCELRFTILLSKYTVLKKALSFKFSGLDVFMSRTW
jgi:hypothetical protein